MRSDRVAQLSYQTLPADFIGMPIPTGALDLEEYVLAMQLIDDFRASGVPPEAVPAEYVPPSKK